LRIKIRLRNQNNINQLFYFVKSIKIKYLNQLFCWLMIIITLISLTIENNIMIRILECTFIKIKIFWDYFTCIFVRKATQHN